MTFEDRLRESFRRADGAMPDAPISWEPTITRARRERARRIAFVTAAAVVAIGAGAWSAANLVGGSPGEGIAPADPRESATPTPEATEPPAEDQKHAQAVRTRVLDWVKALALGEAETAWTFMSPRTHEHFDGDIKNFRSEMSGFSEGFGAWYSTSPPPETTWRVLASSGDGIAGIVELHGQVAKEGTSELAHDALPVRIVDGEVLVEPFSSEARFEPVRPTMNESYRAGEIPPTFAVEIGVGGGELAQVNLFHDDSPSLLSELGSGRVLDFRAESGVPEDLAPGPHFLTVAAVDESGGIATFVVPYFVE